MTPVRKVLFPAVAAALLVGGGLFFLQRHDDAGGSPVPEDQEQAQDEDITSPGKSSSRSDSLLSEFVSLSEDELLRQFREANVSGREDRLGPMTQILCELARRDRWQDALDLLAATPDLPHQEFRALLDGLFRHSPLSLRKLLTLLPQFGDEVERCDVLSAYLSRGDDSGEAVLRAKALLETFNGSQPGVLLHCPTMIIV